MAGDCDVVVSCILLMGKFAIFLLAFIASTAGGAAYYLKLEEQRADLKEKTQSLADIRAEHERRAAQLIPKKQESHDLQVQIDKVNGLTADSETLTAQIQTLEKGLADLKREFIQAVLQIRQASVGMAWPDVTISDGRVLTNVR